MKTNIITTPTGIELVNCDLTAEVLMSLYVSESPKGADVHKEKVPVFESAEIYDLVLKGWKFEGSISVSNNDSIKFVGLAKYDWGLNYIVDIEYLNWNNDSLILSGNTKDHLNDLVEVALSNHDAELYQMHLEEQEDIRIQDREDELMGS